MKKLLATVALAAVIASPALAQRDQQSPPTNPPVMTAPNATEQQPAGTVGQGTPNPQRVAPRPQHDGAPDSKALGTDPDPRIRQELPRSNDRGDN
jgi:hypothetical protein